MEEKKEEKEEKRTLEVLALDLEGTLINSIYNPVPRPHLFDFLNFCYREIPHVVLFTAVRPDEARKQLIRLEREGSAPKGTATLDIVKWKIQEANGTHNPKDLRHVQKMISGVPLSNIFLVDDLEYFVALGQKDNWLEIKGFYGTQRSDSDVELLRIKEILKTLLKK